MATEQLPEGLYELLTTDLLSERLGQAAELQATFPDIGDGDAPDILSRHVADAVRRSLSAAEHADRAAQPLSSLGIERLKPDFFDVVVIDEFHHAMAPTYRRMLEYLKPQQLLGLAATPERGDGVDVTQQSFRGRTASELRFWDVLDADLLGPFHYCGVLGRRHRTAKQPLHRQ